MEEEEAVDRIKEACAAMAREMMRITQAVPHLGHKEVQERLFETMYQLTTNVETVKKQVGRIGGGDGSTLL